MATLAAAVGHATSTDLAHWKQQAIALEPGVHPGNLFSGGGGDYTSDNGTAVIQNVQVGPVP